MGLKRKCSASWDTKGREQKRLLKKRKLDQAKEDAAPVEKRPFFLKDRSRLINLEARKQLNISAKKPAFTEALALREKGVSVKKILNRTNIAKGTYYR